MTSSTNSKRCSRRPRRSGNGVSFALRSPVSENGFDFGFFIRPAFRPPNASYPTRALRWFSVSSVVREKFGSGSLSGGESRSAEEFPQFFPLILLAFGKAGRQPVRAFSGLVSHSGNRRLLFSRDRDRQREREPREKFPKAPRRRKGGGNHCCSSC